MKALDLVPSHLRERLGVQNVSLSYVIRDNATPNTIPEQAMDELIDYTPHTGQEYTEDNAKVFQIMQDMVSV